MRKLLILFFLFPSLAGAQYAETAVKSEVKEVTVFLSGVQETRMAKVNIPAGRSTLRFEGLAPGINPQSIRVKGVSGFTLLSVNFTQNFLQDEHESALKPLRDSIERLNQQGRRIRTEQGVLSEEKNMFGLNLSLVTDKGLNTDNLNDVMDFVLDRMRQIEEKLLELSYEKEKNEENLKRLNQQLKLRQPQRSDSGGEVRVHIQSDKAVAQTDIQLIYLTSEGGWRPFYDIRSEEVNGPVMLNYKAYVFQHTGYDWNNVKLTLSTASPQLDNTPPQVPVWELDFASPLTRQQNYYAYSNRSLSLDDQGKMSEQVRTEAGALTAPRTVNTEFVVKSAYSIPSDKMEYTVDIGAYQFEASYRYSIVPKVKETAYLMAGISGWYEYSLLPAETNIYYRGTFVGKAFLDTETTKDTLDISLGSDESIIVKRKNVSGINSKTLSGNSRRQKEQYEISIRNTKRLPVSIEVEDQIPVSKQKEIAVETEELSGGKLNKETGKIHWEIQVPANETVVLKLGYTVKYPKNYVIHNL